MTSRKDQPERRCGDCTACCTIMGVTDLGPAGKPAGERCAHVCSRGCRIYEDRPQSCRAFACLWKKGGLPPDMRPDKMGAVGTVGVYQERQCLMFHVDPARPRQWRQWLDRLRVLARGGVPVALGINGKAMWVIQAGTGELCEREPDDA